jgi:hypothetical protein
VEAVVADIDVDDAEERGPLAQGGAGCDGDVREGGLLPPLGDDDRVVGRVEASVGGETAEGVLARSGTGRTQTAGAVKLAAAGVGDHAVEGEDLEASRRVCGRRLGEALGDGLRFGCHALSSVPRAS